MMQVMMTTFQRMQLKAKDEGSSELASELGARSLQSQSAVCCCNAASPTLTWNTTSWKGKQMTGEDATDLCGIICWVQQGKGLNHDRQWHGALLQQITAVWHHAERAAHKARVSVACVPDHKASLRGGWVGILVSRSAILLWCISLG